MDPVYTPARKIHLYHCDHRGLPLALISTEGATACLPGHCAPAG
nr:RHS domain-containing protein [Escherichia coli]